VPLGRFAAVVCAALALSADSAGAQLGYFGQNKVHFRDFEWQVLRGPHVDLYSYPEARDVAQVALAYAEESFTVLERKFGHSPVRRVPLIVYASHQDFEQTNVLSFVPPEGVLGVTEFLKRRVAVPFNGSYAEFRHTLRHEMVHAFQLSALADLRLRYSRVGHVSLPLWWTEGLAEFWSAGEDALDEMVLRDLTISGRMPRLRDLTYVSGGVVYPIGGAIHRWLAERFGEWRVQVLYRDLWKYGSFEAALEGVYGLPFDDLEAALRYHLQRIYYPSVTNREPLATGATPIARSAIKPIAYRPPGDSAPHVLYLSSRTGYVNIYSAPWPPRDGAHAVLHGERSAAFESFHPFQSRLDVRDGIVAFSSKYLDRDALVFWDLERRDLVGRYQFPELVAVRSPAWAPDGKSVVLSGLDPAGQSDLYRVHLPDGRLERLTSDRYQDLDPTVAPDGRRVVFASDRTPLGADGALNLFILDVQTGAVRALTYGNWHDETPRWSETGRIFFSSDRAGVYDVYSVDESGQGRRETHTLTGAFDPQWVPEVGAVLFTGFDDLTFSVYAAPPASPDTAPVVAAAATLPREQGEDDGGWSWPELEESPYADQAASRYEPGLSLDFAFADALVAPGIGSAQGLVVLFSDLLGDHNLYLSAASYQARDLGNFLDNLNAAAFYLNRTRRLNWGVGAFRERGLFYESDFSNVYDETSFGGFVDVRWPLSRFARVSGEVRVERSDRFDFAGYVDGPPERVGWLVSNYVSWVHDNSLWLPSGPIDGQRTNVTAGITNDLTNGRFDAWLVSLDHREYHRIGLRSSYALRGFGYLAGGSRPRRANIGGSWGLRGYPRFGYIGGTRVFLLNQELRFPVADFVTLGFPFGAVRFPGVDGALFLDLGGAWTPLTRNRSVLGSGGLGLRLPLGYALVLRLDLGWKFDFGPTSGYGIPRAEVDRWFTSFFFGFNY
jgi:hypothetical protein